MPAPKSRPCWNPAVPPPPVAGATVGIGLGDGLTVAVGDGLGEGLVVGLALGLGETLGETEAVAEGLTEDDDVGVDSAPEPEGPEHAETVTEARIVRMPHPTASLALNLVPAVAARTFMEPPRCPRRLGAGPQKRRGP
jgi:hypothetical protein